MKKIIQSVTILFCFLSISVDGQNIKSKRKKSETMLTVMTYNVHHCNPPSAGDKIDIEAIARVIKEQKPDLVALQEIDVNTERSGKGVHQAKRLAELLGMTCFFSKAIDHQGGEYGVAVLSRFPILDSGSLSLPIHPDKPEELRAVASIKVKLPTGEQVLFASTHLGLKEPNRQLQAEKIIKHFEENKLPLILAGDFNAVPESAVIQYFDQYFKRTCSSDCAPTIPVEKPNKTIDFIMVRNAGHFEVLKNTVIDEKYASDHLPVVAHFRLK